MTTPYRSVVEALLDRAKVTPTRNAFHFLTDGADAVEDMTFAELDASARAVAARLEATGTKGPVLLLYPPGLDFIRGFFGCLYAKRIAVPTYPPDPSRPGRSLARTQSLLVDCGADTVLTSTMIAGFAEQMKVFAPRLEECAWVTSDDCEPTSSFAPSEIDPASTAFLQYTSGSTGDPKGVVLSHRNLRHNVEIIDTAFGEMGLIFSWLPLFHDMGLIGHVITSVINGSPSMLMSPLNFLQNPFSWLRAISKYGARTSGAPMFAWDLCTRKVTDEECATLDLSQWKNAYCGAEPLRGATFRRFVDRFGPRGFSVDGAIPCYGLAEGTLMVTADRGVHGRTIDRERLAVDGVLAAPENEERAIEIVSAGRVIGDQKLAIVDPELSVPKPVGSVGEIWISGGSIAAGYLNKPEVNRLVFEAKLAGDDARYFRTGDLGAVDTDGRVYITGRSKDLIIVRGRNVYPQDIERVVEQVHPAIRRGCVAAFAVDGPEGEGLGICFEPEKTVPVTAEEMETVLGQIRALVAEHYEVLPVAIAVVNRGQIPKTSSGKLMRQKARHLFANAEFEFVTRWATSTNDDAPLPTVGKPSDRLLAYMKGEFGLTIDDGMRSLTLPRLGLDSMAFVRMRDFIRANWEVTFSPIELDEFDLDRLLEELDRRARR